MGEFPIQIWSSSKLKFMAGFGAGFLLACFAKLLLISNLDIAGKPLPIGDHRAIVPDVGAFQNDGL